MRELKILIVLVFFTAVTYWGIEPYAHSVMHPHTQGPDYEFSDLDAFEAEGNVTAGKELFVANCQMCHSLSSDDLMPSDDHATLVSYYGVFPPDLSTAADLYDEKFLANFIKNPALAAFDSTFKKHSEEKLAKAKANAEDADEEAKLQIAYEKSLESYTSRTKISMPGFEWMSDEEIASIIEYMKSVKKSTTPREATAQACGRCHAVEYDGMKENSSKDQLISYLGTFPPDLSQMIKSKGHDYLHKFINDPQKQLLGTTMPRVGLTQEAEKKIVHYMETVGDAKKQDRENLGLYTIIFFVIMTIFAYFFKVNTFRQVH